VPADATSSNADPSRNQQPITETTTPALETAPDWATFDPLEEAARRAGPKGRIDKSALPLSEPRRLRDVHHLRRVAARPCVICGRNRAQAHHIKFLQPNAMGRKVSDEFTVPLCSTHHGELHASGNELHWWQNKGIDPKPIAMGLWQQSTSCQEPNVVQPQESESKETRTDRVLPGANGRG
jgi:hypothetical protein